MGFQLTHWQSKSFLYLFMNHIYDRYFDYKFFEFIRDRVFNIVNTYRKDEKTDDIYKHLFIAPDATARRKSFQLQGVIYPYLALWANNQFDWTSGLYSHPNIILRTSTSIGADADTLPRDPFNVVGIRFTLPGALTDVRVASLAEYKWAANKPLFVDYI